MTRSFLAQLAPARHNEAVVGLVGQYLFSILVCAVCTAKGVPRSAASRWRKTFRKRGVASSNRFLPGDVCPVCAGDEGKLQYEVLRRNAEK